MHHEFYWDSLEEVVYWAFPPPMDRYDGPRLCSFDVLRQWTATLEREVMMFELKGSIAHVFSAPTESRILQLAEDLLQLGKLRYQVST